MSGDYHCFFDLLNSGTSHITEFGCSPNTGTSIEFPDNFRVFREQGLWTQTCVRFSPFMNPRAYLNRKVRFQNIGGFNLDRNMHMNPQIKINYSSSFFIKSLAWVLLGFNSSDFFRLLTADSTCPIKLNALPC